MYATIYTQIQPDGRTYRLTDDMMMPIADHTDRLKMKHISNDSTQTTETIFIKL